MLGGLLLRVFYPNTDFCAELKAWKQFKKK